MNVSAKLPNPELRHNQAFVPVVNSLTYDSKMGGGAWYKETRIFEVGLFISVCYCNETLMNTLKCGTTIRLGLIYGGDPAFTGTWLNMYDCWTKHASNLPYVPFWHNRLDQRCLGQEGNSISEVYSQVAHCSKTSQVKAS